MRREASIQREVVLLLSACGLDPMRVNVSGVRGRKADNAGMADLYCTLPGGYACWIEVKALDGKQSAAQADFQRRIERMGGEYLLARSVGDVRVLLRSFGLIS